MSDQETLWICPNCNSKNLLSKNSCYLCGARSPYVTANSVPKAEEEENSTRRNLTDRQTCWECPVCKSKNSLSKNFCYMCGTHSPYAAEGSVPKAEEQEKQEKLALFKIENDVEKYERTKDAQEVPSTSRGFPSSRSGWLGLGIAALLFGAGTLVTGVIPSKHLTQNTSGFGATLQSICSLVIGVACIYMSVKGIGKSGIGFHKKQGVQTLEELVEYLERNDMPKQAAEIRAQLAEMKSKNS